MSFLYGDILSQIFDFSSFHLQQPSIKKYHDSMMTYYSGCQRQKERNNNEEWNRLLIKFASVCKTWRNFFIGKYSLFIQKRNYKGLIHFLRTYRSYPTFRIEAIECGFNYPEFVGMINNYGNSLFEITPNWIIDFYNSKPSKICDFKNLDKIMDKVTAKFEPIVFMPMWHCINTQLLEFLFKRNSLWKLNIIKGHYKDCFSMYPTHGFLNYSRNDRVYSRVVIKSVIRTLNHFLLK